MFEKILDWQARRSPNSTAFWSDAGTITYAMLARHVAQMTTALQLESLPRGVILIGELTPAMTWLLAFALERLGHPTAVASRQIDDDVAIIRPAAVITDKRVLRAAPDVRVLEASDAWRRSALHHSPTRRRSPAHSDDVVRVVLSSGTTGVRKPVPITRRAMDARIMVPLPAGAASTPRFLQSQGMDTIGGFRHPLTIWLHGGAVAVPGRITEQVLKDFKPTLMAMSPASLQAALPVINTSFSTSDRVHIWTIGSALPPSLIQKAAACQGVEVSVVYSSTEGGNIASGPASIAVDRPGAVGFPNPWADVQVIDDDGKVASAGQSGAIRVRGEGVVSTVRAENNALDGEHTWFYPNDRGRIDPDGMLIIEGRTDDVINLGGVKMSSARIEETILACEGVTDAAVVVFPSVNGRWMLVAGIVANVGCSNEDIRERVRAIYGIDVTVVVLPEIIRNPMGKIMRAAVRETLVMHIGDHGRASPNLSK